MRGGLWERGVGPCSGQLSQCPGPLSQAERSQLKGTAGHACPLVAQGIKGCILIDCSSSGRPRSTPSHSHTLSVTQLTCHDTAQGLSTGWVDISTRTGCWGCSRSDRVQCRAANYDPQAEPWFCLSCFILHFSLKISKEECFVTHANPTSFRFQSMNKMSLEHSHASSLTDGPQLCLCYRHS